MNSTLIADYLKKVRAEKSITQEETATMLGVSSRTYQRIEAGESHLSASDFLKFLKDIDDSIFLSFLSALSGLSGAQDFSQFQRDNYFYTSPEHKLNKTSHIEKKRQLSVSTSVWPGEIIVGYWEWNLGDNSQFWSDDMYRIYEVPSRESISPAEVSQLINPEDVKMIEVGIKHLIEKNIPYVNQHRVQHSQGECVVNATAIIVEDEGKPLILGSSKGFLRK